jgi:hypothetical protein
LTKIVGISDTAFRRVLEANDVSHHSLFLQPKPTIGGLCSRDYTRRTATNQTKSVDWRDTSAPVSFEDESPTTIPGINNALCQIGLRATPPEPRHSRAAFAEHQSIGISAGFSASFLPIPRALIEIARRRGLAVAAAAMDAGLSAPVLRS